MGTIIIRDLEVSYRVGVPDAERALPQRLLISVEIERDFAAAAASDDLRTTIDYYWITQWLLQLGQNREWKLLERLAADIGREIGQRFDLDRITVEVKKFVIPQARYVAVRLTMP